MADKISVSYDANIDDMKRKLDELIAKNKELSAYATAAAKALSNIASAQGLSTINNINNSFNTTVNVLSQVNTNLTQVNAQLNNTTNNVTRMGNVVNNANQQVSGFDAGLNRLGKSLIAAFSINQLIQFGKSIVDVTRKTELMQNRLAFTFGSLVEAQMAFDRLYRVAQKLGLEFAPLIEGFSKFSIAAKFAGFSARQSEEMFVKVSAGLRAAGASSLQTQRAFLALEQMLSKGVVAAEELRRQLGEALPGAVALMAKAYNKLHPGQEVTIRQFMKLQEEGKIISAEVLPEFANTIEETLAPALAGKAGSLDAAINRLNSSFENIKRTMGMANLTSLSNAFGAFGKRLENVASVMAKPVTDQTKDGVFGAIFTLAQAINQLAFGDFLGDAKQANKELEKDYQDLLEAGQNAAIGYATLVSKSLQVIDPKNLKSEELIEAMQMITSEFNKIDKANLKKTPEQTKRIATLQIAHGELNAILTERFQKEQKLAELELTSGQKIEEQRKAEIAAAKELLAAEETRLFKTTEGTAEYYNQLIKTIKARMDLIKVEKRDTPEAMGLDLAKQEKDLKQAERMIGSFIQKMSKMSVTEVALDGYITKLEEIPEILEEGVYVPSVEALQRLDKENRAFVENQLQLNLLMAQRGVEITEEGTEARLIAERNLALEVAELEKFKVKISNDSEELKDSRIKLINNKLRNEMKKLGLDYAKDQKEIQDKIVEDQQKTQDRIADIIQDANDLIERTEGDSFERRIARSNQMFEDMARKLKEEMSQTSDFNLLAELIKKLNEVENAGKKAASAISFEKAGEVLDSIGGLYGDLSQLQAVSYENDAISLKKQLDQKLISEQEYERKAAELARKRFEHEKQVATVSAIIEGASGVMKAIGKGRWWDVGVIAASTAIQIATIQSQQFPGFKEGVIDLQGSGTGTSDSIPARLSRGESVMTADETKRYKPVLQAIRDNNFEEFASKRYIDAMGGQSVSSAVGNSFAENLTNSFDLQTAELAHLLKQNRKVAIKNVDELAKAMSRRNTTEKVINRRRFK